MTKTLPGSVGPARQPSRRPCEETVQGVGNGVIMAVGLSLPVCTVGAITCVVLYVRYRRYRPR